jgi:hypothetical protein
MGGAFDIDHDRFVRKNKSLAAAYRKDEKDRKLQDKGYSHLQNDREASCFNCKKRTKCPQFRRSRDGSSTGAVSFGGGDDAVICDQYEPEKKDQKARVSDKKVKSLLKNMKKKL